MKRESGLVALTWGLLTLFSSNALAAPAAPQITKPNFARVKAVSPFEIDLTWRDRAHDADGYKIERSTNRTNFRQIAQVQPGTTIFRDKNLFPGTQYFYRIRSFNTSGSSSYDLASARTQIPVVPLSVVEWGPPLTLVAPTNGDLVSVAAGAVHGLALKKDGTVIGWGDNTYGESTPPTNLTGVIAIAAGQVDSLALKNDGTVVQWGYASHGLPQGLGPPVLFPPPSVLVQASNIFPHPPIPLPAQPIEIRPLRPIQPAQPILPPVIQPILLNPQPQSLALPKTEIAAQAWFSFPSDLTGVVAISAGTSQNLALKGDGTVVGWGDNTYGQAMPPADLSNVVAIAAGDFHSLALKSDGTVVQWGNNADVPTNLNSVVAIAAGTGLSVAVKDDGTMVLWGNTFGLQLAGATSNLTNVAAVALGTADGLTLNQDGSLSNWSFSFPSTITPDLGKSALAISVKNFHHLALSTAPAAPSNPLVTVLPTSQLRLSWQDNSSDEKSFAIERSGYVNGNLIPWTQIGTVGPNTTNFVDTTAQTNATYEYRVRALGKFGTSPYSTPINAALAPLQVPTDLSATLGSTNAVNLSWYDVFSGIDSFKIERAPDDHGQPGTWTEIASDTVTNYLQNTFLDSTVQPNNIYWYRVRAANVLGFSDYSVPVSISVTLPTPPQFFSGTPFANSITLSWSTGPTAQGSKLERAPDLNGAPGAWTQIATIATLGGGNYTDQSLPVNTTYWYRVRTYNWIGDSDDTAPLHVTVVPPAPPASINVNVGSPAGVDISWYPTINDEDGFELERALDAGGAPGAWTQIASFNDPHINYESFHDSNVVANTIYWYRVRSFNLFGFSDYSPAVSIALLTPSAPTLTATTFADSVNLQWQESTPNISYFKIERTPDVSGSPGPWMQIAILSGGESSYNDPNVTPGAVYWYRIRAENWLGYSPYSGLAAVTIVPPHIPAIQSVLLSISNEVELTITDPGDEDGFLVEHAVPTSLGFIDWTQIARIDAPRYLTTYLPDTNITVGATNLYRVRAFNSVGISDYSETISIPIVAPAQPSLTATFQGLTATVIWNDDYLASQLIQGYRLQRAPDAGGQPGTWQQITNLDGGYSTVVYYDTDLAPATTYWYRVQAFNWVGNSAFSDPFSLSFTPPNAPFIQSASLSVTNQQADIFWYDFSAEEDGIMFERAPDQNDAPGAWSQIGVSYATNSTFGFFADTNAIGHTTNWYRLRSFNASGFSDYSTPVQLPIVPPSSPSLSAAAAGNLVTISWYDSFASVDGVLGYKLERAPNVNGSSGAWIQLTNAATLQYYDSNLAVNSAYWYRVRSYNWVGDGNYSAATRVTIVPPTPPSNLSGSLGDTNTVLLQWIDIAQDEDGFTIERVADAGGLPGNNWQEIGYLANYHSNDGNFADTNVTANTTNWYRVRAFSATGLSTYDGDVAVRVMPPKVPVNVFASPFQDNITVSWYGSTGFGRGGFVVQRAPDNAGAPGNWTDVATKSDSDAYYNDIELPNAGTYWYRVRAFNWIGSSDYSSPVDAVAPGILPPAQPYALSGYALSATNQVFLSWYDYGYDQDGFQLQRAPNVAGQPGNWTEIATVYSTNSSSGYFTDTNVTANSTNWYRVQAFSRTGASEFSPSNFVAVTAPVLAPSITQATPISPNRIDLAWQGNDSFIQGYTLERAPDNNGAPGDWTVFADPASSPYRDNAVAMNQKYWYRVQSYNWSGTSPYSDPSLVVVAAPLAPALTANNDQPHQFTLAWILANSANVTSVKIERAPNNHGLPGTWIQIAEPNTVGANLPTTYTDIGIPTGQTFWYRVRAVNAVGNSPYSNIASGTPNSSSTILLPPQILSLTPTNSGLLIEWSTTAGNTDFVQASGNFASGYTNLSPSVIIGGIGTTITNYFEPGALTNSTMRFYRIQSTQ